jgi:hypothetical protein
MLLFFGCQDTKVKTVFSPNLEKAAAGKGTPTVDKAAADCPTVVL